MERLRPGFVEEIPDNLEPGINYISLIYHTSAHLCPCGCGSEIALPLHYINCPNPNGRWWEITINNGLVTLDPSVGNFHLPCKSHYWIQNNKIIKA